MQIKNYFSLRIHIFVSVSLPSVCSTLYTYSLLYSFEVCSQTKILSYVGLGRLQTNAGDYCSFVDIIVSSRHISSFFTKRDACQKGPLQCSDECTFVAGRHASPTVVQWDAQLSVTRAMARREPSSIGRLLTMKTCHTTPSKLAALSPALCGKTRTFHLAESRFSTANHRRPGPTSTGNGLTYVQRTTVTRLFISRWPRVVPQQVCSTFSRQEGLFLSSRDIAKMS